MEESYIDKFKEETFETERTK